MSKQLIQITLREIVERIAQPLERLYDSREAKNIASMATAQITGLSESALRINPNQILEIENSTINLVVEKLCTGLPIQHLIGHAHFYDREFAVDNHVLIPRQETEELVDWVIKSQKHARTILDVGTGSGCIAATLSLELPEAQLYAADISERALEKAAENCRNLGAKVIFRQANALENMEQIFPEKFDVIISNPPYVPESDRRTMHINVLNHEPELALFVPDHDPICFYRAIAKSARVMLLHGGALYFEIYAPAAQLVIEMLEEQGYQDIKLREDLSSKPRMICCRRG